MAYNRRSGGGGGYGGGRYNSGGGGGGSGGGGGGYRTNSVNPWQSNSGAMSRQGQQGGNPQPAQLAMASNIISKLLTSSNSMSGSGYGGHNQSNWGTGHRISHMGMRRQDGPGGYNKDNRRRGGGDPHRFSSRKSGGIKDAEKRKHSGKMNDEIKKGQNDREKTKEQLDADKKVSYVGVPSAVLYCHVCSKHMWDSESFEKHIRGRPHELMLTYLDETYKMRVDIMRHQIKAVENQREIDLERVTNNKNKSSSGNTKSPGTSNASKPLLRSYCPMCDVRFYGPLTGHRKSDRHRKLKQFLHPECKLCDALFHTRLEMDEHKLTAGHLKKVAELRNTENPELKDDEFDLIDMIKIEEDDHDLDQIPIAKKYEMLSDRDAVKLKLEIEGSNEKYDKKKPAVTESNENPLSANVTTDVKESVENISKTEDMETSDSVANDSNIENAETGQTEKELATNADLSIKDNQAFTYDPDVAIGKELLVPSTGFVCRLCNCYLMDEQRVSIHCQTASHYINYTTMTKMKEATSGSKKRGIDKVNEEDECNKIVIKEEQTTDIKTENLPEKSETDSAEQPAVKRIKLEPSNDVEENDTMDITSEQSEETKVLNETESVKNTNEDEAQVIEKTSDNEEKPLVVTSVASPVRGRGVARGRGGRGFARRGKR